MSSYHCMEVDHVNEQVPFDFMVTQSSNPDNVQDDCYHWIFLKLVSETTIFQREDDDG